MDPNAKFTKNDLEETFETLWAEIKKQFIAASVSEDNCEKIRSMTAKKLSKSNAGKKITLEWVNNTITARLNEAAYNVFLMKFKRDEIICPLELSKMANQLEEIFKKINIIINSNSLEQSKK